MNWCHEKACQLVPRYEKGDPSLCSNEMNTESRPVGRYNWCLKDSNRSTVATKTTSPTARMESWRILLHIAATLGWDAQQIDIKTAFLYGLLPEDEVQYMEQLEGFLKPGKETWVWKLLRGLYGMKQAGRIWNRTMNEAMISWGFTRLGTESCVYYRLWMSGIIITAVHVDDFLAIASLKEENSSFKEDMRKIWMISDLGDVSFCVRIAIKWDRIQNTIYLSQTALIDRVIAQFGQKDSHPVTILIDPGLKLRCPDKTSTSSANKLEHTGPLSEASFTYQLEHDLISHMLSSSYPSSLTHSHSHIGMQLSVSCDISKE